MRTATLIVGAILLTSPAASVMAQVNSGSDGSDGAFKPMASTNINMANHPSGIYRFTSVNIPSSVSVSFTPNANNTPVVWLVQGDVVINGIVLLDGQLGLSDGTAGIGGPGGYRGGNGSVATPGQGPGGGSVGTPPRWGGNGSYATAGFTNQAVGAPGLVYGNNFLIPLVGGSGGAGGGFGGGGGGGAILIVSSGVIEVNGKLWSRGGHANSVPAPEGGSGSGGAVRLVSSTISGRGNIDTSSLGGRGGNGRVRFDCYLNNFAGTIYGAVFTQGSQFVTIPGIGSETQLAIKSVAGVAVSAPPSGIVTTPDAVIPAQQSNPVPVVVQCAGIPLGTQITVTVTPVNGPQISGSSPNNIGTSASSTATVMLNMPRGGGLISASAATGN